MLRLRSAACLVLLVIACAAETPPPDFRETAVIPSFKQRNPDAIHFRTFYRQDLDARHQLLVVRASRLQLPKFLVIDGDLLGLFLADRGDPDRVWELGVFAVGNRADLMWVDRSDGNSIVFARVAGDYGLTTTYWKFFFDVPSKQLLKQLEYMPVAFGGFRNRDGALVALGSAGGTPVAIALEGDTPRIVRGARQGMDPRLPAAFPPSSMDTAPRDCRNIPQTDRFSLDVARTKPEWVLGVRDRRTEQLLTLPQTTLEEYSAARPSNPNTVIQENIIEHIGPYQISDRFWFGKVFYDGEGQTGVGSVGYFDPSAAKYVIHSPQPLAPWSVSALLVESGSIWAGLMRNPEGGSYSGGLIRLNPETDETTSYLIPDIVTAITRHGGDLVIATMNGCYVLRQEKLARYTVEPGLDGSLQLYEDLPVQVRSGLPYDHATIDAPW